MKKLIVKHDTTEYPVKINITEKCPDCRGLGVLPVMERTPEGNYIWADDKPCHCQ